MKQFGIATVTLALTAAFAAGQSQLMCDAPGVSRGGGIFQEIDLTAQVEVPASTFVPLIIYGRAGSAQVALKFRYTGVTPSDSSNQLPPNFVVVSPSAGTTSVTASETQVAIGLNQGVLRNMDPGVYSLRVNFSTIDQSPASQCSAPVNLALLPPPAPQITSIVSSASFQSAISPGELVTIFGANVAPPFGSLQYDDTGAYPTTLGDGTAAKNTTVAFNGVRAALLYVSPTQINAMVPYEIGGQTSTAVVLTRYGQSATVNVPVLETAPGIFTVAQNGSGQGAILDLAYSNPNIVSYNGASNPVPRGDYIEMFATGSGSWNPAVPDGALSLYASDPSYCPFAPCPRPAAAASVSIGGQPATIYYLGSEPYNVWGVLEVIARVPAGVASGQQPVVLTIGQHDNSKQNVTVAVQ